MSEADLLIHVVDLSHSRIDEHIAAVNDVTKELGAFGKQTLLVFNKIDALGNGDLVAAYRKRYPGSVAISARTGEGVGALVQALQDQLSAWRMRRRFRIPLSEAGLIAETHRIGHVLDVHYDDDAAIITANVPPQLEQKLAPYAAR